MDPLLLKILAALFAGLAAALFVIVGQGLLRSGKGDPQRYGGDSMRRAEVRRRALANSWLFAFALPVIHGLGRLMASINAEALRAYVREPYARAGYPGGMEDDEVVGLGVLLGILFTVFIGFSATVLVGPYWTWVGLLGFPVGFLAIVSTFKTQAAAREVAMLRALPYVLDLIVLILRSGTTLGIALGRVVEDLGDHPLGDELGQVLAEMNMGAARAAAFKAMSQRLKITDITALTDSVIQSEELGWPLADTLERLANRLATERSLRAQTKAGAAGVWVMIPSTLVLMSAVLLLFGPIIVRVLRGDYKLQ